VVVRVLGRLPSVCVDGPDSLAAEHGIDGAASYSIEVISPTPDLFALGDPAHVDLHSPRGANSTQVSLSQPTEDKHDFTKIVGKISGRIGHCPL
jgi:hypothetical protein